MVFTAISIVTSLVIVLLIGLVVSIISSRFNVPDALFLILAGMAVGQIPYAGEPLVQFPELFLTSMALVALALILFDGSTRIKLKQFDKLAIQSTKLTMVFLFFELLLMTVASWVLLDIPLPISLLLSSLIAGTSSDVMTSIAGSVKNKMLDLVTFESIINTPITVILPFLILDVITSVNLDITAELLGVIKPLIIKVVAGVGSGAILFILLYKILSPGGQKYSKIFTPLTVILCAMLAFVLAENIGGDGVLSVTTLGLLFGNFIKKSRLDVLETESIFSKGLYVLVFVMIGLIIKLPLTLEFISQSGILFLIYLAIRFFCMWATQGLEGYSLRELIFGSLHSAKGIATATLVLTFAIYNIPGSPVFIPSLDIALNMSLAFILYSLTLSTVLMKTSDFFLKHEKRTS
jgi:potassium/hydrogen antiporter